MRLSFRRLTRQLQPSEFYVNKTRLLAAGIKQSSAPLNRELVKMAAPLSQPVCLYRASFPHRHDKRASFKFFRQSIGIANAFL
jgi:hypothetical protein